MIDGGVLRQEFPDGEIIPRNAEAVNTNLGQRRASVKRERQAL